uniref:Retrotransposon gag domain-containing protein n=1 Tax=Periophthalmus magnuspinnatus TaxID=409849 RepID=A0A3B3ZDI1_9GOBI
MCLKFQWFPTNCHDACFSCPPVLSPPPLPNGLASMDQADSGPDQSLRQACSHHEMIIGQHEQSIRTLLEFNQSLYQQVVQLTNQVTGLLAAPPAASGTPSRPPELRGTDPEPYSGQPHLCRGFLFQCQLVFQQCPTRFNSGAAKIHYLRGLLRGKGLQWAEFVTAFKLVFDHPYYRDDAAARLLSLNQGSSTVADYTIEFWTHAAEVDWMDSALRAAFVRGLNKHLKDELVSRNEPSDLRALITLSNRIDNRLKARRRERRRSPVPPELHTAPPSWEEPMQVDRTLISAEKRRRRCRLDGACLYCGEHGHFIATCLARSSSSSSSGNSDSS